MEIDEVNGHFAPRLIKSRSSLDWFTAYTSLPKEMRAVMIR